MFKTTHIHARIWLSLQPWGLCLSFDCTHIEWPCSKPPTSMPRTGPSPQLWGLCVQVLTVQVLRDYSQNHPHPHQNRTKPAALGAVCPSFDCTGIAWLQSKPPTSTPEQDQARGSGGCVCPSFICAGTERSCLDLYRADPTLVDTTRRPTNPYCQPDTCISKQHHIPDRLCQIQQPPCVYAGGTENST